MPVGRDFLNTQVMSRFSRHFTGGTVYWIGKHQRWDYRAFFPEGVLKTTDINPSFGPDVIDDILDSKIPEGSADGVVYIGMDEDITDTEKALENIHRILKPGGRLLIGLTGVGDSGNGKKFGFLEGIGLFTLDRFLIEDVYNVWENNAHLVAFVIARKP